MMTVTGVSIMPGMKVAPSLYDIGWGLARMPRFAGHTKDWYSVLPHTYAVAAIVPPEYRIHALLHDAAEAIVGDKVSTWKGHTDEDSEMEILDLIYKDLGLPEYSYLNTDVKEAVLEADLICRAAEAHLLGHANALLFEITNQKLYDRAYRCTVRNITTFTPEACIYNTATLAKDFQKVVNIELEVA